MQFFGGQVFSLPIEKALGKHLVNYYYRPIFVNATEDEEGKFKYHSQKIAGCFRNNVCIDPDQLVKSLRNRLRVISMADEKKTRIEEILSHVKEKDHFVVYCGDGKLFDDDTNEEMRHIRFVKGELDKRGYKPSQFTAKENMAERIELVDEFNKGNITALSAIRCLDEGINIPSIKAALILSSNDDYREFVQRRGRILRKYDGKKNATIYDVIVLPSEDLQAWAKIELRRFLEYAKLAINWDKTENPSEEKLQDILDDLCLRYGLSIEDIDVYDYEEVEEPLDE
jgi:superfamily II DNA or RNA helicase